MSFLQCVAAANVLRRNTSTLAISSWNGDGRPLTPDTDWIVFIKWEGKDVWANPVIGTDSIAVGVPLFLLLSFPNEFLCLRPEAEVDTGVWCFSMRWAAAGGETFVEEERRRKVPVSVGNWIRFNLLSLRCETRNSREKEKMADRFLHHWKTRQRSVSSVAAQFRVRVLGLCRALQV